ncbi:hypothetical protein GY21_01890 [Cryobacterium roopkundense]|uniref:Na+/glutamate symporter n=1 Tax=Cryobacterium roopkundense TaxID=1001240 RepID=A0A099JSR8_9MICO|nr:hypothetical protein [Cryobacterium roopkundense]KGJ81135.1 hypothetical protein GY21_01890 [Cryobacterium roopkundense]MBB5641864.1 Na+/glutamate symporter [Cryobacterium roopkundense]
MELLFVALGGALLGLAARYLLPGRSTMGVVLIPALAMLVASAVWVALTWLGWKWDAGAIWWVSLGAAAAASVVAQLVLARRRTRADSTLLHALMKTGAPGNA